jgi:uncharacterized membrane protein
LPDIVMAPLIVLLLSFVIFRLLGGAGVEGFVAWEASLRWGLAVMFVFTGIAHFTRARADLVRMVPASLPCPDLLVTITGVLEMAGAVGLLVPSLAPLATWGLILMLVAMFPANLRAARERLPVAGRVAMPWPGRLALQLFWIGSLWVVMV